MLKRLTNLSEHRVYEQISNVCNEFGAEVYRKIRVADVIDISKLASPTLASYGLMAHFDFVVANDNHFPLFALEFDGKGHDFSSNVKKDGICVEAELALFRVNLQTLDAQLNELSFLQYLVQVWFYAHEFERLREMGQIPPDEPFVMSGFLKPDAKHVFDSEFEFTLSVRRKIAKLLKQYGYFERSDLFMSIAHITMSKDMEKFASFVACEAGKHAIFGTYMMELAIPCYGSLASVPFGSFALADFVEGRAHSNLLDNVSLFCIGAGHTLSGQAEVLSSIGQLSKRGYRLLHCGGKDINPLSPAMASLLNRQFSKPQ